MQKIKWTDDELLFLRNNYSSNGCKWISDNIGKSFPAVQNQAHRMGLYRDRGLINMIGEKYGKWTVIGYGKKDSGSNTYWLCRCECGAEKEVQRQALRHGKSKQCPKCASHISLYGFIPQTYIKSISNRCRNKGIDFDLDAEYLNNLFIAQDNKCALSGEPIVFGKTCKDKTTASLDRIKSGGGYVKGNVQWLHIDVNFMKSWIEQNRFIELCKKIVSLNENKGD